MQSTTSIDRRPLSLDSHHTNPEKKRRSSDLSPPSSPPLDHFPLPKRAKEERRPIANERTQPKVAAQTDIMMEHTETPAERARKLTIVNDPMANLLSANYVECKQCRKKIKLSSKSAYDTFHWRNHRARCVRTFRKKGKKVRPFSTTSPTHPPLPTPPKVEPLEALAISSSPSVVLASGSPRTPPLMSDNEDDRRSERSFEVDSPSMPCHPILSAQGSSTVPWYEYNVHDYIARSHPGYIPGYSAAAAADNSNWRSWSWSQLKPPQFHTGTRSTYNNDGTYDADDDDAVSEGSLILDEKMQEAARTLSLLSRSH